MAITQVPKPTLTDKLLIFPVVAKAVFSGLMRLVLYPVSSGPKANTLSKDVMFAILRAQLGSISPAQEQWLNPTTESVYLDFTKKAHVEPDVTTLSSGLKVAWIGPKTAQKVILYLSLIHI